eukprot:CAMPEP_0168627944 /NCGR_PEP_ID=MMETSP0449_2-20121227/11572_1 /TAXON_ID=1082188 /ORGANISM="Strombidium rassoulzadegani, Strain ras09" /LENGTH=130 /DNA_ID=CAMNT_0008670313 /DNA_START=132 /DNA_END=524 /DNA_ORIENTATION=+
MMSSKGAETSARSLIGREQRAFGKIVSIDLPDLGEGTKEATIKEWYVEPGTKVNEFDDLVEVFTDKLVAKIPSTCTGIVKDIKFQTDDVCLVGHSLLSIEIEVDDKDASSTQPSKPTQQESGASAAPSRT